MSYDGFWSLAEKPNAAFKEAQYAQMQVLKVVLKLFSVTHH